MRCPSCSQENREQARFCDGCGAVLEHRCPKCDASLRPAAHFCDACGQRVDRPNAPHPKHDPHAYAPRHLAEKILASRAALEGERKQVTVLFADVKGSMELAEQMDPEAWHGIMDRFFQLLADGVHRFEGTVNQYTGDGIMALFGAPIAHEDHAQRACWAALHLARELRRYADELRVERGLSFSVRMGLNSGEVVVGRIGDDLRMEYTAQGHTVGLAARMEQIAEPGTVLLAEPTAALVSGYFALRDLGLTRVRGVQKPVRIFALEGAGALRTRFDVSRARGLTRFVGRDGDLQALEAALESARQGHGQVVGVVGEAGLGKSRLCFEFLERCRARGTAILEARAVAHGKDVPFLPILQIFRAYFGITEQDGDRAAREKIAGRLLLIDESFREALPLLFDFFGVPDPERPAPRTDAEARQQRVVGVLRRLVQGGREADVGVTLIEDLHWIDRASDAFLAHWVDAIAGSRNVLLVNFRPEYHAAWTQKSYYRQIPLAPLGAAAIEELLGHLLGTDPSIAGLAGRIHERTAGNPFFTEEVVQSLLESGHLEGTRGAYRLATPVERLEVPATVQALLAARIDRLAERDKRVLQTAAVIGKEFSEPILTAVAELPPREMADAIAVLEAGEFVYEEALFPVVAYAFKHPLTREVALGSQLQDRRRRTHAAVARAIEAAHAGRLEEQAGLLAHHWEEAGEARAAARGHGRAAGWAGTRDLAATLRHWQRVRELLRQVPAGAETAGLGVETCFQILILGWRLGASEEEVAAVFAEGKALAGDDPGLRAMIVGAHGVIGGAAGAADEYVASSREALCLARQTGDARLVSFARALLCWANVFAGHLAESLAVVEEELRELEAHPYTGPSLTMDSDPVLVATFSRGWILRFLGRLEEAARDLARAEALAREKCDGVVLSWVLGMQSELLSDGGDHERALRVAQGMVEVAERTGDPFGRSFAYFELGSSQLLAERWEEATSALETSLGIMRTTRTGLVSEPSARLHLAEAYAGQGDTERARRLARETMGSVIEHGGNRTFAISANLTLARVLQRVDGAAAAGDIRAALDRADALVDETGAETLRPFVNRQRAELARLLGDEAGRRRELAEAQRLFAAMGAAENVAALARELDRA